MAAPTKKNVVMWCLSGGIFVAAMSIWFREKKAEPPIIALCTALLFALPNVRNSQPGIPPIAGTTSDSERALPMILPAFDDNTIPSSGGLLLEYFARLYQVCTVTFRARIGLSHSSLVIVVPFPL